ncbi:hypothetical protein E2562_013396 [Oryza meyeriana var. granulata]|uniref:Uncharacterized protein n=1 Tax=Oryza meyeriana var. granulata TaxID=110450 RepID=A0A6G1CFB5_9ORYZ|nr:hypothetical protein E2562_013396 [Oryza meyeriana var. granulata]
MRAGDGPLDAGVFCLDLAGERPRTTSPLSAEKNPCFLSLSIVSIPNGMATNWQLLAADQGSSE